LPKQPFRVSFLEKVGTNFAGRDLRRNCQDWRECLVRVEQTINEMEIPGPATSGADGEITRQLRLRARRKSSSLLVAHMDPFQLLIVMNRINNAVQRISDDAVDPTDSGIR